MIFRSLKRAISRGETGQVIKALLEHFEENHPDSKFYNEIIVISARHEGISEQVRVGIIDWFISRKEIDSINNSLLEILDLLTNLDVDVGTSYSMLRSSQDNKHKAGVRLLKKDFERCLAYHLKLIDNWSRPIRLLDPSKAKNLNDIYIDLEFYYALQHVSIEESQRTSVRLQI